MAYSQVFAVDLDGTLTSEVQVSAKAVGAIDRVRCNGLKVVLDTGRVEAELQAQFGRRCRCRRWASVWISW